MQLTLSLHTCTVNCNLLCLILALNFRFFLYTSHLIISALLIWSLSLIYLTVKLSYKSMHFTFKTAHDLSHPCSIRCSYHAQLYFTASSFSNKIIYDQQRNHLEVNDAAQSYEREPSSYSPWDAAAKDLHTEPSVCW